MTLDRRCLSCGSPAFRIVSRFQGLARVSSDCKPVAPGGMIGSCEACGLIQKIVDAELQYDIGRIYDEYDSYYQGAGLEQIVFDGQAGAIRRSELLARHIDLTGLLPTEGRCLDFGCGRGAFLLAIGGVRPRWKLSGLELDARNLPALQLIPGFEKLEIGVAEQIAGGAALISMIHALEHVLDPGTSLATLREKLAPGGLLFIEVPNVAENPFDLTIADHVSHFTPNTLSGLLSAVGFEIASLSTDWVKKEISVLARVAPPRPAAGRAAGEAELASRQIEWLQDVLERAREASERRPFGIFGTSIAAVWLSSALGERIDFYVDEDVERQKRAFRGKPVVAPATVPDGATIFIGLAPVIATRIADKIRRCGVDIVTPPPLATTARENP